MTYLQKCAFLVKQKTYVKVFNVIIRRNEAKTLIKQVSCKRKCKLNSTHVIQIKKEKNETCQCERVKIL